jgi:hypothetical protein
MDRIAARRQQNKVTQNKELSNSQQNQDHVIADSAEKDSATGKYKLETDPGGVVYANKTYDSTSPVSSITGTDGVNPQIQGKKATEYTDSTQGNSPGSGYHTGQVFGNPDDGNPVYAPVKYPIIIRNYQKGIYPTFKLVSIDLWLAGHQPNPVFIKTYKVSNYSSGNPTLPIWTFSVKVNNLGGKNFTLDVSLSRQFNYPPDSTLYGDYFYEHWQNTQLAWVYQDPLFRGSVQAGTTKTTVYNNALLTTYGNGFFARDDRNQIEVYYNNNLVSSYDTTASSAYLYNGKFVIDPPTKTRTLRDTGNGLGTGFQKLDSILHRSPKDTIKSITAFGNQDGGFNFIQANRVNQTLWAVSKNFNSIGVEVTSLGVLQDGNFKARAFSYSKKGLQYSPYFFTNGSATGYFNFATVLLQNNNNEPVTAPCNLWFNGSYIIPYFSCTDNDEDSYDNSVSSIDLQGDYYIKSTLLVDGLKRSVNFYKSKGYPEIRVQKMNYDFTKQAPGITASFYPVPQWMIKQTNQIDTLISLGTHSVYY